MRIHFEDAVNAAEELTRALGGSRGMARCPAHRDRKPSLCISQGRDGRPLVHCHAGCQQADVIGELRRMGLWQERERRPFVHNPRRGRKSEKYRSPVFYRTTAEAPKEIQRACEIWRTAWDMNDVRAEPQCQYISGRGIFITVPETLRGALIQHPETRETCPALIVARRCPHVGLVRGIQRIFLTEDGQKYPHGEVKISLGSIVQGRCELFWVGDAEELLLAEGLETALSVRQMFKKPAWCFCGGFPGEMHLNRVPGRVTICADHDLNGGSERRAKTLASFLRREGRYVTVRRPARPGLDGNDLLREVL